MVDKEKQKIKKAREAAGEDVDDISPKVRTLLSNTPTQISLTLTAEAQDG
jgi:hypothetical protein